MSLIANQPHLQAATGGTISKWTVIGKINETVNDDIDLAT